MMEPREVDVDLCRAAEGGDMEELRRALADGADPNAFDEEHPVGRRALHLAVRFGHVEAVHALLAAGADPNKRTEAILSTEEDSAVGRNTPLMLAMWSMSGDGRYSITKEFQRRLERIMAALISGGADVDADQDGGFPRAANMAMAYGLRRALLMILRAGSMLPVMGDWLSFSKPNLGFSLERRRGWAVITAIEDGCEHASKLQIGHTLVGFDGGQRIPKIRNDGELRFLVKLLEAMPRPVPLGFFFIRGRHPKINCDSTYYLTSAIKKIGGFDEYARRLQRDVHVAIITKCVQDKLPLEIKTVLTTYLWNWGGA